MRGRDGGGDENEACRRAERHNQCGMSLVEPVFPIFIKKVIFLTFKERVLLEKRFLKKIDQSNMKRLKTFSTQNTPFVSFHFLP